MAVVSAGRPLYPPIEPHATGMLDVGDGHTIYWEECGNPAGKPVVFLHGGPGSGCSPSHRCFFDPAAYRIVLFDQRGAGRSLPFASLENNTTAALVGDMEKLRQLRGIERWQVFGGSWGSTLALAYAEAHPDRVTELVLRGIFTLRRSELEWFYQDGASHIFPDAWAPYLSHIPEAERGDLIAAYHRRITGADPEAQMAACKTWSLWEGQTSKLFPDADFAAHYATDKFALAFARIECHYFQNRGFFATDDELLANAHRLSAIPTVIVQGRYDLVCPATTAFALKQRMPHAEFILVPDAGHSAFEPGIQAALLAATDKFRA